MRLNNCSMKKKCLENVWKYLSIELYLYRVKNIAVVFFLKKKLILKYITDIHRIKFLKT